jgi:hypothetical protein
LFDCSCNEPILQQQLDLEEEQMVLDLRGSGEIKFPYSHSSGFNDTQKVCRQCFTVRQTFRFLSRSSSILRFHVFEFVEDLRAECHSSIYA